MTDPGSVADAELVALARQGDQQAMVELWTRHYPAVLALARKLSRQPRDAEEMASDAFAGMLAALGNGGGPTGSVRAYLRTSVKNVAVTRSRRSSSTEMLTDDIAVFEDFRQARDPVADRGELGLMREAFSSIPRRWQTVLWRTAVDHESNINVAEELGMSPNAVAALARRARRGLRAAYVQAHVSSHGVAPECEPYVPKLADLAVDESRAPDDVAAHVETCERCTDRLAELRDVERNIAGVLGPAVLALLPAGGGGLGASSAGTTTYAAWSRWVTRQRAEGSSTAMTATMVLGGLATIGLAAAALGSLSSGQGDLVAEGRASTSTVSPTSEASPSAMSSSPLEQLAPSTGDEGSRPSSPAVQGETAPGAGARVLRAPTSQTRTATSPRWPRVTPPARSATAPAIPPATHPPAVAPRPTPTVTPKPTPTVTPTSSPAPITLSLSLSGGTTTAVRVDATSVSTKGPLALTMTVPAGVSLATSSGDWRACTQSGTSITCTGAPKGGGAWSGVITLTWPAQAPAGTVRVDVAGRTSTGAGTTGAAWVFWPPLAPTPSPTTSTP